MHPTSKILHPESNYHVYNRASGSEKLFLSDENYRYFLKKYQKYVSPRANTFCYCLMPNHFHFLIRVKAADELAVTLTGLSKSAETQSGFELSKLLSQQFSHLFNGYTQAFNKQNNRKGGLFMTPFKRKLIHSNEYLLNLVKYIHQNPLEAKICQMPEDWPFSSYAKILKKETGFLNTEETISWFETIENFKAYHSDSSILTDVIKFEP